MSCLRSVRITTFILRMGNVRIIVQRMIYLSFPVGQKFTCTQLVFGSIAFQLFNLGQMFRVAFHQLPTISWVNFGPFLLARTCFFSSAHKFYMGLKSGLCDLNPNLDFVVLKPFCHNFWKYAWDYCPFERPICDQAITS